MRAFPRAHGPATNVVVTEYELPHVLLATHDVSGDSKGNIWYSSHRTPFMGMLDPKHRHRYRVPGAGDTGRRASRHPPHPGGQERHRLGLGELGAQRRALRSREQHVHQDSRSRAQEPLNTPGFGNFSIGPDGSIWFARDKAVQKFNSKTGKLLERVPFTINAANPYDNIVTDDGNFWAGGSAAGGGDTIETDGHAHQQAPRGAAASRTNSTARPRRLRRAGQSLVRRPRRRAAQARRQGRPDPRILAADART